MHVYEVRPRSDQRSVDLISDALPFGRLWYGEANAISNAIGYPDVVVATLAAFQGTNWNFSFVAPACFSTSLSAGDHNACGDVRFFPSAEMCTSVPQMKVFRTRMSTSSPRTSGTGTSSRHNPGFSPQPASFLAQQEIRRSRLRSRM